MEKTVNILGETQREQWLNAVMIFETCVCENVRWVREELDGSDDRDSVEKLDIAMRNMHNFADEMRRLVKGVFDEQD